MPLQYQFELIAFHPDTLFISSSLLPLHQAKLRQGAIGQSIDQTQHFAKLVAGLGVFRYLCNI
jgi:hypothetical protein